MSNPFTLIIQTQESLDNDKSIEKLSELDGIDSQIE